MKKIIFIFFIFLLINFFIFRYDGVSKTKIKEEVQEEIMPIRNREGDFLGIISVITIPKDMKDKTIKISSSIFGGINEFKNMEEGSNLIQLKIINKSKYKYKYIKNSLKISTVDNKDNSNYNTKVKGFDKLYITDDFLPYRVNNTAIKELDLDNPNYKNIDNRLKEIGYRGICEIDKYYLDFYYKKYNLNIDKLEKFSNSIMKEIFDGESLKEFENNKKIVSLAYYYFYNNILTFTFNNKTKSIKNYMDDLNFNKKFINIKKKSEVKIKDMSLNVSDKYMSDAFNSYKYIGKFEFRLNRS